MAKRKNRETQMDPETKRNLTAEEVAKLSDADVLLAIARESLVKYGTALPPYLSGTPRAQQRDWSKVPHTCPRCHHDGFVVPDFGVRVDQGREKMQSWCRKCRSEINYHPPKK